MSDKNNHILNLTRRPRRLRQTSNIRKMFNETEINISQLIQPLFVVEGKNITEPIKSMPGINRYSIDKLVDECKVLLDLGILGVALFPKINSDFKCDSAKEALNPNGLNYKAIRELRRHFPQMVIIADLALDPYTKHGHDGLIVAGEDSPLNDETVEILEEMAVLSAFAGADIVAPSDMMDGRVAAIRKALDSNKFKSTLILSYAAKFASAFYGPFREAIGSSIIKPSKVLDKTSYQLNPANRREAKIEVRLDEKEGADILMIKPAGPYLDIIRDTRESSNLPIAAYQVSGEYAQIMASVEKGWLNLEETRRESLISIRRAGADIIISYFSKSYAESCLT